MKKYWHIAFDVVLRAHDHLLWDDDEALEVDEVWKVQNEEAFQARCCSGFRAIEFSK